MAGVAVVTGGGTGLGRVIARRLGRAGLRVAVLGRREAPLREVAAELPEGLALPCDVREPDQVMRALDAVVDRWGRLDLVVNNAALLGDPEQQRVDPWTTFSCVLRTNVLGPALVTELAVPRMRDGGLVVMIGSSVAALPTPDALAYGASKAALEHLVGSLARRHLPRRLRVVGLAPGGLFRDEGAEVTAADGVAEAIVWLASRWGRHVNGTTLRLDDGEVVRGAVMDPDRA